MKIIFEKQNEKEIHIDDITEQHIVVAVINEDEPAILTRERFEGGEYKFRSLSQKFTNGNGYMSFDSIKSVLEFYKGDCQLQAFHQKDWFKAMEWLNENTKES